MPPLATRLVAAAFSACLGVLAVAQASAQTVTPGIGAGNVGVQQPALNPNVLDRLCDVRTGRDCVRKPKSQERTAAGPTRQSQNRGVRPGQR